ncbi:hypothetical protein CGZ90_18875 [Fictibacillus aquaticus]|uniref:Uncharacterized protein n=1 Tax=Fictibacillus aquaticus TaxID=2021314 RepID=A0A235F502_9BACL|nr:hypothetical protein [Fictibacillus aquaticus]OYD56183.1 hypothetical protein CGZ90_18875 [Fictibacillus aquaticus]
MIKPALVYGVFILLVTSFSFFAVLMGRNQITFKESIGRFGSMLIPFTAMLAISLLFILMNSGEFSFYFLLAGFAGSILLVPPLFISSYFRKTSTGLDPLYGSLIVYILTGILFKVMGEMMFETISKSLEQIVTFFGLF